MESYHPSQSHSATTFSTAREVQNFSCLSRVVAVGLNTARTARGAKMRLSPPIVSEAIYFRIWYTDLEGTDLHSFFRNPLDGFASVPMACALDWHRTSGGDLRLEVRPQRGTTLSKPPFVGVPSRMIT